MWPLCSTLTISAPRSPRIEVVSGPDQTHERSSTRKPSSRRLGSLLAPRTCHSLTGSASDDLLQPPRHGRRPDARHDVGEEVTEGELRLVQCLTHGENGRHCKTIGPAQLDQLIAGLPRDPGHQMSVSLIRVQSCNHPGVVELRVPAPLGIAHRREQGVPLLGVAAHQHDMAVRAREDARRIDTQPIPAAEHPREPTAARREGSWP